MAPFTGDSPRFAVALSGGPDSMALCLLLNDWAKLHNGTLHAFTVDHKLRDNSTAEAAQVGAWLKPFGIPHHILTWQHAPLTTGIHENARTARYDLLLAACHEHNLSHLFLAHHADDQAETVLMRFARGSGPDGLAGMPLLREQNGVRLCRPLLPLRKQALIDLCKAQNWPFVTDPSNAAPRFARARLREAQDMLAREGLTVERLYDIARLNGIQRAHVETEVNNWMEAHATADIYGVVKLDYAPWAAASQNMRGRTLTRALMTAGGDDYAPRGNALDRLEAALLAENFTDQTLGGCVIARAGAHIIVTREESAVDESPAPVWDRRFAITGAAPGTHIKKLGLVSREKLEKMGFKDIAALPAKTRASLPAILQNGELADMPVFGQTPSRQGHIHAQFSPYRSLSVKVFQPCPPFVD